MKTLSVKDFPLYGQSLIEASAGTGKTFTITGLYNRLILGHGRKNKEEQNTSGRLGCDQILVVTFTRAATEELRGRIRQRLRDTLEDLLRLENEQPAEDSNLNQYLQDLATEKQLTEVDIRKQLLPWLQSNLALMDEAAIYTIHGFCQRMLKQFAFDSGVMFDAELVLDSETYLQQACEDIWRDQAYALSLDQSRFLLNSYSGPDDLYSKVKSRISRPDIRILPDVNNNDLSALWQKAEQTFLQAKQYWQATSAAEIADVIQASALDKKSYSKRNAPAWVGQAADYFAGSFYLPSPQSLYRLTPQTMAEKLKDGGELPDHPVFNATEEFLNSSSELSLLLEMAWLDVIKERYFELLDKAGALTPDDLLRLLAAALQTEQGELLASQIRHHYPLAMIDEFQDTDPQQYGIFNRIYPPSEEEYGLIMIGDPKQAIYGFRGADIFTYIQARRQLSEERRFTLGTNWRSHSQLVAGVNQLFSGHESPFVFNRDIDFIKVDAAGKADQQPFIVDGKEQTPLQLWHDSEEYSRAQAHTVVAQQCAQQIYALLTGNTQLGSNPVQAKDIAVLVRSRKQAGWIRDELTALGIGSVFLTRDSVYDSLEASDLFCWLQAVAHPSDERALRTALATQTQGYTAQQLDTLLNDEQAWENVLERNFSYHQLWNRRGVMAAVMQWLEEDHCAQRLRCQPDGERRLTNIMHLGELLQAASRRLRGHEALLRWFGEHVLSAERSGDEAQLRLESDANLVTIVTIHKSKGLEYPLVFLPYLWDDSYLPDGRSDTQYYSERDDCMVLNLNPDDDARAAARRDSLAESLRLLYVALTRAVQGCFVWLADAVDGRAKEKKSRIADTALGYLLQLDADPDWQQLQSISGSCLSIAPVPQWPAGDSGMLLQSINGEISAVEINPLAWDDWRVSSYSQLTADHGQNYIEEDLLRTDETEGDAQLFLTASSENEHQSENTVQFDPLAPALTFAKGPDAGTCLHAIFEHWDFQDKEALLQITENELNHYGLLDNETEKETDWVAAVSEWINAVVSTPLMNSSAKQFSLQDIKPEERLDEMEFYLPVDGVRPEQINALLAVNDDNNRAQKKSRFHFDPLSGYLKGFIDLIFCFQGRYYVADYKSNYLGSAITDYTPVALKQAMLDHQYDLQAWIYTVALDQLLRQRLPDYSPQQHLGGVYYFYLRGMHLGEQSPLFELPFIAEESDQKADPVTERNRQPDLFSEAEIHYAELILQAPGVYFHSVDVTRLEQWRRILLGEKTKGEAA